MELPGYRKKVSAARRLRRNSTDAERAMWRKLRNRRLEGHKFRRQVPFPPYVVDFLCDDAKLVIEVDGGQHDWNRAKDEVRTRHIEQLGFRVIRFWNNDVLSNMDGVLQQILIELKQRWMKSS
jgi:very-short-patch-repair endonuclease